MGIKIEMYRQEFVDFRTKDCCFISASVDVG